MQDIEDASTIVGKPEDIDGGASLHFDKFDDTSFVHIRWVGFCKFERYSLCNYIIILSQTNKLMILVWTTVRIKLNFLSPCIFFIKSCFNCFVMRFLLAATSLRYGDSKGPVHK